MGNNAIKGKPVASLLRGVPRVVITGPFLDGAVVRVTVAIDVETLPTTDATTVLRLLVKGPFGVPPVVSQQLGPCSPSINGYVAAYITCSLSQTESGVIQLTFALAPEQAGQQMAIELSFSLLLLPREGDPEELGTRFGPASVDVTYESPGGTELFTAAHAVAEVSQTSIEEFSGAHTTKTYRYRSIAGLLSLALAFVPLLWSAHV
uniref:Uncharacterized protein n=1 Tax=Vitrella brassicaformis TaxID=1169539 RepID=A0A7S1K846_9ALVE